MDGKEHFSAGGLVLGKEDLKRSDFLEEQKRRYIILPRIYMHLS